jgi:hypothetical protein
LGTVLVERVLDLRMQFRENFGAVRTLFQVRQQVVLDVKIGQLPLENSRRRLLANA